jgi:hypothetical protein
MKSSVRALALFGLTVTLFSGCGILGSRRCNDCNGCNGPIGCRPCPVGWQRGGTDYGWPVRPHVWSWQRSFARPIGRWRGRWGRHCWAHGRPQQLHARYPSRIGSASSSNGLSLLHSAWSSRLLRQQSAKHRSIESNSNSLSEQ